MSEFILVVDDDSKNKQILHRFLELEGYEVASAGDGEEALNIAREQHFDLVITDLKMPKKDGIELLKEIKELSPSTMGVVVTGFASIDSAVEAMKVGAFDYVSKPFQLDEIRLVVKRALDYQRLQTENYSLKKQLKRKYRFENIIGDSPQMQEVFRMVEKVADTDSTILITGESGTGKELIAKAIHYNSKRRDRFLIPVNCGAIPETLLESELFGHVKGAFTGAIATRIGRFEAANGGTIFLDEIAEMSPNLQVKILRVLQEQEFEPVGSTKTKKVDVRIIAATNQNLDEAVKKKKFREDLYYRLHVIPIQLPPLRERNGDIPLLVNHFWEKYIREKRRHLEPIGPEVMEVLQRYDWPGNVRELENLIERIVILNEKGKASLEELPDKIYARQTENSATQIFHLPDTGIDFNTLVEDFESRLIKAALERSRGNKNLAAKLLGLKRTTLVEKIKKKGVESIMDRS